MDELQTVDHMALFESEEFACARCGYNEFDCSVEIHHMDHDRSNNKLENLLPLCANCHKALHDGCWNLAEVAE